MSPLALAPDDVFRAVRFVLTDMDETLTFKGRLAASTYTALEHLQAAGVVVIPVTAAPAGWCDQMARMWPVDGVIAENGGLFLRRASQGHGLVRDDVLADPERAREKLALIDHAVRQALPWALLADDQPFRLTSLAYQRPQSPEDVARLEARLRQAGAQTTVNNLWVLGWLGDYDKLTTSRQVLAQNYGLDLEKDADHVLYCGDSQNDEPMFGFFRHTVGVSTVREHLTSMAAHPAWITQGPGGAGFVEVAEKVIASRGQG